MDKEYDFSGWATRNNLKCSDGRVIRANAFKHNDGERVPLVWNHNHDDPRNILGYAVLENRPEGVYSYGKFNDTDDGQHAKKLVQHGDISALSIHANNLKQNGPDVLHGDIKELSLVIGGANPGAVIESVISHGEGSVEESIVFIGEEFIEVRPDHATFAKNQEFMHSDVDNPKLKEKESGDVADDKDKTVKEILDTLTEEQKTVVAYAIGSALENAEVDDEDDEVKHNYDGGNTMKRNLFESDNERVDGTTLTHSDEMAIISLAKQRDVGSLRRAMEIYAEENELSHGIDDIETLFPDYKDVRPGAPEMITRDLGGVGDVMQKVHKSPISRIRTRQADVRGEDLRASGYQKGKKKNISGNIKLLKRTTDPQTVYRKDALHRDDIVDITDFDVTSYQYEVMRQNLHEELAVAFMIGDGREEGDENKISEEHIRPIWTDDDLYTIHTDVDVAAAKAELQGSNTSANFGDNYIRAEAIITAALYSREKYKGSGTPDFYCTPHLLNVMLLARDLNGRRIYDSKSDLAAALNVAEIRTAEQFEGKTRTTKDNKQKKLLGIFVNLADYYVGSTKGGEITKFEQFDIDFNQNKYLIETRLSGALTKVYSAIALEEPVAEPAA